ncbi:ADP-ribose glycohydrolase MACROD2-like [Ostrinia furnacalis]|uniref:ADP-ribose glycohydrolase MACROD2-like n=1 Tax=Ostrinia furnacalis TaxID=93504 RepID=UPI00103F275B|nr:ADP-ribose glycohydrolase MACROD2-like [Ostrinia furnacalis]
MKDFRDDATVAHSALPNDALAPLPARSPAHNSYPYNDEINHRFAIWSDFRHQRAARWAHSPAHTSFPYNDEINHRFAIWQGDITSLEVDAITNTTDETLLECNAVSERILLAAGPGLKEEILTRALECRTGEVTVTPGFRLRCRHVLHTVGPAYTPKYHTAAETSLQNCYKNVLYRSAELGARSLALCVVSAPRRAFPPDAAAHVALRTIRRYLEQNPTPALVILACARAADAALYASIAPAYFPRSAAEQRAGPAADLHERRIRIIHNPHSHNADSGESRASDAPSSAASASYTTRTRTTPTAARIQKCICSVASDHTVTLLSLSERKCVTLASRHLFPVVSIKWRPLDDFMVVGCSDGTVYVWQMETGHLDRVLHGMIAEEVLAACDETLADDLGGSLASGTSDLQGLANPAVHFFRGLRHRNVAAMRAATQRGLAALQGPGHASNAGPLAEPARARRAQLTIQGFRSNPKGHAEKPQCHDQGQAGSAHYTRDQI